jgi:hypothetical protein
MNIEIEHGNGSRDPQSACEKLCLKEMCANLRSLGALEGRLNRKFS